MTQAKQYITSTDQQYIQIIKRACEQLSELNFLDVLNKCLVYRQLNISANLLYKEGQTELSKEIGGKVLHECRRFRINTNNITDLLPKNP